MLWQYSDGDPFKRMQVRGHFWHATHDCVAPFSANISLYLRNDTR